MSSESIHHGNNHETGSSSQVHGAPASSIGSACGKSYRTMAVLNSAVRYATMDGFIGILDMFGFEDGRVSFEFCLGFFLVFNMNFYFYSLAVWSNFVLIFAPKRCSTFIIRTFLKRALSRVGTKV